MAEIDLLRLSELVRDAVLNSRSERPIVEFETAQIKLDDNPAYTATFPIFKITHKLSGVDDFAGIDITIEVSGDAAAELVNALSGV